MDWKEKIRDLKQQFEEFWERHLQRGAGRFSAPPPFVGLLSHKLFRLVLKSRIFSFQSFLACRGLGIFKSIGQSIKQKYRKNIDCTNLCLVALWGQQSIEKRQLRIQGDQFLKKKSALNLILIANSESRGKMLHIPLKIMDLGALCVELWLKQVLYRILVPMSYISFWEQGNFYW